MKYQLRQLLKKKQRKITLDPDKIYEVLGVKWYGLGLFVKDSKKGGLIKATHMYEVNENDFIYNRLFAWKGSFALATKEFSGCVVSNEFPTFEINKEVVLPIYLKYYFLQPWLWEKIDDSSSGMSSVSRKRFKEENLLALNINIPSIEEQRKAVEKIEQSEAIMNKLQRLTEVANKIREKTIRKFFLD